MHAVTSSVDLKRLPSPALRRFSWGVLIYFIAVILWGALVRATGSGAGCGDHWPLCNGTVMQHSPRVDTMIEFTHRITSGLSFFLAVGLLVWTLAGTVRGHLARAAAIAAVAFTLVEAILGALIVKLGLTAASQSPLRAPYLALHLANTLLLLAALTLAAHFLSRERGYLRKGCATREAFRRIDQHLCGACGRGDRIAGRAGRHTISGNLARIRAGRGFCEHQRVAGALAMDASNDRIPREHFSDLDAGAGGKRTPIGTTRPRRDSPDPARSAICAGRAGRNDAGAGVAADRASARRRCTVGGACRADGETNAAANGDEVRPTSSEEQPVTPSPYSLFPYSPVSAYFTSTPAAG